MSNRSPIAIPEGSPIAFIVGNPAAHFDDESNCFVVRDQLVAIRECLRIASQVRDSGRKVRLSMMLDHKHHKKQGRVPRTALLDPDKRHGVDSNQALGRAASIWPTLNLLREDIRKVFRGQVTRFGFRLSDVRVMPEESLFWYMDGQLSENQGFPDYQVMLTDRSLYTESPSGHRTPRCISIFAGAFLISTGMDFQRKSPEYCNYHAVPRQERMPVVACFQKDGNRVTRVLIDQAQRFLTSESGYSIDPKMISVSISDEVTVSVPHDSK